MSEELEVNKPDQEVKPAGEIKQDTPPDPLNAGEAKPSQEVIPHVVEPQYPEYNDPTANAIINTFKTAKIPPVKAAELLRDAVAAADISKINTEELVKLLGEDAAELTTMRLEKYFTERKQYVASVKEITFSEAGSEENWKKIITWANAKAEKDDAFRAELKEYAGMVDKGKTTAKLAIQALKRLYESDSKNSSLGVKMIQGDKAGSSNQDETRMTRVQYVEKLKAAHKAGDTAEVDRLNKLRAQMYTDNK